MQLVLNPRQFDVILTEGAFGGVISDQASAVAGSLGLLPSASVGDGPALFEPLHGPCTPAKGKGTANPIAAILSAAMMLDHFGLPEEARAVRAAVENALSEQVLTPELSSGASYTTEQVGSFIAYGVLDLMDCYLHRSNIAYGRSTII
jgi:3-isopropylmalate dehydrogenase